MRKRLAALLGGIALAVAGCAAHREAPLYAGTGGTACNRPVLQGIFWDRVHRYYVYDYYMLDGNYSFCWQYFQRVPGSHPAPDPALAFLFLPPAPPNGRPHGALVTLYAGDFRAIDGHRGSRALPPMYTFDDGTNAAGFSTSMLRGITADDPVFNTRLAIGDVVVWDTFAHLVHTNGGPGGHDVAVWKADALADYLAGYLVPLPAHSGY